MRIIDIGIVSSAIGRRLTLFLFTLVLAITVSAMWPETRPRPGLIRVGVSGAIARGDAVESHRALARLLTDVTGAPARIVTLAEPPYPPCELYLLPSAEYCRDSELRAIYAVRRPGGAEGALVVTAPGDRPTLAELSIEDVVFAAPGSVNGCWLQADAMSVPVDTTLRFVRAPGRAERVVAAVMSGRFRAGACAKPDFTLLLETGVVAADEVQVAQELPGLPEVVLACRAPEQALYEDILSRLGAAFTGGGEPVAMLEARAGIVGFAPVGDRQREALAQLYARVSPE